MAVFVYLYVIFVILYGLICLIKCFFDDLKRRKKNKTAIKTETDLTCD